MEICKQIHKQANKQTRRERERGGERRRKHLKSYIALKTPSSRKTGLRFRGQEIMSRTWTIMAGFSYGQPQTTPGASVSELMTR